MTIASLEVFSGDLLSPESVALRREAVRATSRATLGRRRLLGRLVPAACAVAVGVSLIPLVALLAYVANRGIKALSVDFFVNTARPTGVPGGGISNALVGSGIILGLALVMAIPMGLLVALFLVERSGRLAGTIRFVANVMAGVPSIAIGIFAYALIVVPSGHFSAISGSFALAVLMLPILVRTNEEALRSVPDDLWEAGLALGARRSRVVRRIVMRGALPGLVTGNLLAMARAVGETAPLLFTALGSSALTLAPFQPMNALPLVIYGDGVSAFGDLQTTAWGTAFVLLTTVFVLSIAARSFAGYLTRKAR